MIKLYPSSMRRILNCPASKELPEIEIDSSSQATIEGNAYHEAMEIVFKTPTKTVNEIIENVEKKYDVTIGFMVWQTLGMIKKLENVGFNLTETEGKHRAEFDNYILSGRIDARGTVGKFNVLVDYKGGYKDTSATDQLLSYASIINKNEGLTDFKIITIYGRLNNYDVLTVDEELIKDFDIRVERAVNSKKYSAGEHCEYCPMQFKCPAKELMINNAVIELGIGDLPASNPADIFDRVKMIKKSVANYEAQLKDYVDTHGDIQDSEGRTFTIEETEKVTFNLNDKALNKVKERLPEKYLDSMKLNKTALKKIIMAEAPKGLKKAEWEAFEGELLELEGVEEIKISKTLKRS